MASEAKPSSRAAGRAATGYSAVIASDSEAMMDSVVEDRASNGARFFAGASR
jgi:hypothetical protein